MTNEEAIAIIRKEYLCVDRDCDIERSCGKCDLMMPTKEPILEAYNMAIKALEQGDVLQEIRQEINDEFLRCDANAWSDIAKGLLSARCIIDKKIKELVKESEVKQ